MFPHPSVSPPLCYAIHPESVLGGPYNRRNIWNHQCIHINLHLSAHCVLLGRFDSWGEMLQLHSHLFLQRIIQHSI